MQDALTAAFATLRKDGQGLTLDQEQTLRRLLNLDGRKT